MLSNQDGLSLDPAPGVWRHLVGQVECDPASESPFEVGAKRRDTAGDTFDQEVQPPVAGSGRPPADAIHPMLIGHSTNGLAACEYKLFHATPAGGRSLHSSAPPAQAQPQCQRTAMSSSSRSAWL